MNSEIDIGQFSHLSLAQPGAVPNTTKPLYRVYQSYFDATEPTIEMPFSWVTRVRPRNYVLDGAGGSDPLRGRSNFWRLLCLLKSTVSTAAVYATKKSIAASVRLLQPTASLLPTGQYHTNLSPHPCDAAYGQNHFFHLLLLL